MRGHVGIVEAPGDPFLEHEGVEVSRIAPEVDRGRLEHDLLAAFPVDGQVQVAARADLQFADHGEALEFASRHDLRRQQAFVAAQAGMRRFVVGQGVDAQQLERRVVVAAAGACLPNQPGRGGIEVVAVRGKRLADAGGVEPGVGAVGGEDVDFADFGGPAAIVDLDMRAGPSARAR